MNLTEVARKLKVPSKELKEKLPELGFDIGMKAIKVPDDMAERIIIKWNQSKRRQQIADKYSEVSADAEEVSFEKEGEVVKLPKAISVRDLAERFGLTAPAMIAELMKQGIMASLSERVDFEIASIVGESLGIKTALSEETDKEEAKNKAIQEKLKKIRESDNQQQLARPPIVVVMGHVDHGKTKLLDTIRQTRVIDTESGGITQHIGAYQVEKNGQLITFIDTPGHEAFSAMRSRGANVADIAILVIAADDGVKPQTIEAVKMIQDAGLPMVVAINKIDKAGADIEKVKKGLSEINLVPEDWGGDIICIPISAKENKNLDGLLDMVLLVAEMNQEKIKAPYNRSAAGTIIESHLDKGTGPVATVLIQTGTLHHGEAVRVGNVLGKIRSMSNWQGEKIITVTPGMPVRIIGLTSIPEVGEILEAGIDLKVLRRQLYTKKTQSVVGGVASVVSDESTGRKSKVKKLNLVLKADVAGSLEAILQSLKKYSNRQVVVNIVYKGLGDITEVDVIRAASTKALVFGFHTNATSKAYEVAKEKNISIRIYQVIYKLLAEVKELLVGLLEPIVTRVTTGEGEILVIFRGHKAKMIVGAKLTKGEVRVGVKVIVKRQDKIIGEGLAKELRVGPEKVAQVSAGNEFGLQYSGSEDLAVGDKLEFFEEKEEMPKLDIKK